MSIKVRLPAQLRAMYKTDTVVMVEATTVAELLAQLDRTTPGLFDRLCQANGTPRRHINIFVGDEEIRHLSGVETPLLPDMDVWIIPSIAGGTG
ncbi:MAG: molybdopterin synthase sulfur carrier subunit [Chloroflexi bacterium]|nr:molybdopterin synthase sulfur carrier subunit [Chloroflexota bacterium]